MLEFPLIQFIFDNLIAVFFWYTYLPFDGNGNPSKVHVTCGVGFPAAEHFSETAGPGWSVCSIKL